VTGRPFPVTLSLWLVLLFTVWNGLRAGTAISWRSRLIEFSTPSRTAYQALSGALWCGVGATLSLAIVRMKTWAGVTLMGAALLYTVSYWIERSALQELRPNWPFALVLNLLVLIIILFAGKYLMREVHERRSEN